MEEHNTPNFPPPPIPPDDLDQQPKYGRRGSKNPLRSMMQHLSVEGTTERPDATSPSRRESLMRRLSRRASRSPSANLSPANSRPGTSAGHDPNLCQACASWASDVVHTFEETDQILAGGGEELHSGLTVGDSLIDIKGEHFLRRLDDLEDNRWAATCPLCKLFFMARVRSEGEGTYVLSAFSSRDANYLLSAQKIGLSDHLVKSNERGFNPAFLGVIPKKTGPGALVGDPQADWFRNAHMLFRTNPSLSASTVKELKRSRSGNRERSLTPEPPPVNTDSFMKKGIWGRAIGSHLDMNLAREWLGYCESRHQGRCARRNPTGRMPGFKLIDCTQSPVQVVVCSFGESYAALSYVWGKDKGQSWPEHPGQWPPVYLDAIRVTQQLGLQYLWIDKPCLSGSYPEDEAVQMSRMDEIYEGAVVTIIAAHGHDATSGLPGVADIQRPEQPKYTFMNTGITIVSSLRDPRLLVKESHWYSRAWTYQEGLLARRRLIFTEEQVYWECEGMVCQETLQLPLDFYHDHQDQKMCDFVRPGLFNGVSYVDGSWEVWRRRDVEASTMSIFREVDQQISEYSRRNQSDESDRLKAFLGIQRRTERTIGYGKLGNVVGIPIWSPPLGQTVLEIPRTRLLFALATSFWHHLESSQPARKLSNLPSWSWAGWTGPVEVSSHMTISDPSGKEKDVKLHTHHYIQATHITRNEPNSLKWCYSPDMELISPSNTRMWPFSPLPQGPPHIKADNYALFVKNPYVLDKVKARVLPHGGWMFNDVSVDVRLSTDIVPGGKISIRDYIERHAKAEQMTVLWFVEEVTVMLLVVQKAMGMGGPGWIRVGRMRMGLWGEKSDVMDVCVNLQGLIGRLPLRRLGEDIYLY